ncbi:hypothetical protein LTS12_029414, partial [Elasticomyces elasticus]
DYQLRFPQNHPRGWRYMLHTTESFIKYKQNWPVNVKKRQQEEEEKKRRQRQEEEGHEPQKEHEWRRDRGENETHNEAHAVDQKSPDKDGQGGNKDEKEDLQDRYSPQELSLLRLLQSENKYMKTLNENDGKVIAPDNLAKEQDMSIDEAHQNTPDNWIPRSSHLIRITGKHPLNGEPELTTLYETGLITPNLLHYVRNHGPVPHLLWETHKIDVENGKLVLSMDDLENGFESINIAVALACDGNRRKELNMIRRSKGFNFGAGAVSCAYWKGPLLRDILLAAGVEDSDYSHRKGRRW